VDTDERRAVTALLGPGPVSRRDARVLIVDDNEDAARMLAEALEPSGYDTRVACNGAAAIRACEGFTPDIALLDIGMPIMDGYELAGLLRGRPGFEHVRLVAITGYGLQADQERSEAAGFVRHLVKPIDIDVLASVLGSLMEKE
jgi:CheY-like chemotaxis protein